VKKSKPPV